MINDIYEVRVDRKIAILAKGKGFNVHSCICGGYPNCICKDVYPTQGLLQKWLRSIHGIHIIIDINPSKELKWYYALLNTKLNIPTSNNNNYSNYEEALEAGLCEGLNLIE